MKDAAQEAAALADDAIALANEWDARMWEGPGRRVMDPDLADLYRRSTALRAQLAADDADEGLEKPPLDRLIELWEGIDKLHFDDYVSSTSRRTDRLRAKSTMVLAALRHYKLELEG